MRISKEFQVGLEYESTNDDIRRTALVLTPKSSKPGLHFLSLAEFASSPGPIRLYEIEYPGPGSPRTSVHFPNSNLAVQSELIEPAHFWRTSYNTYTNL